MGTAVNMLFALVVVFTIYGFFVSMVHVPFYGAFFLFPFLLCLAMVMFMDHGEGKKKHAAHKHL